MSQLPLHRREASHVTDSARAGRKAEPLDIRHLVMAEPVLSRANGVHHVAGNMVREQIRRGHRARIVFLRREDGEAGLTGWDIPVDAHTIDGPRIGRHVVKLAAPIVNALTGDATDQTIVHIHGGRFPMLRLLCGELKRRRIRYAITIHGRYSHIYDEGLNVLNRRSALYLSLVEKPVLEGAHFVQAVTEHEAGLIRQVADYARVVVVGHAAYSTAFGGILARPGRLSPSGSYPTFAFCGRYAVKHKGLDLLLEGFAQYVRRGGSGRLALAGTGEGRSALQEMVDALGLADRVAIGGPLFGPEKVDAMRGWDYFVQVSRFDVLPTGALEAALEGIPLIVSRATGLGEIVQGADGGFVVGDLTAEAVGEALGQAERVPARDWITLSHRVHDMMVRAGDWTDVALRIEALYRSSGPVS